MHEFYIETLLEGIIHFKDSLNEYFEDQCIKNGTNPIIFYRRINVILDQFESKIERSFEFNFENYDFMRQFYVDDLYPENIEYFEENHSMPLIQDSYIRTADITDRKYRIYLYLTDINEIRSLIKKPNIEEITKADNTILQFEPIDKRISQKAPPNAARIKALKEFCPELWDKLARCQNKETQQNVIHLITAVNVEDSYKLSFGSRQSDRENRSIDGIEELKKRLE
jgi:hypothetical protein